jgi:serine/threonine protein kinase
MIWKIFTETEPWRGILDTDLQGLRYVAEDDYRIQRALEHEVHGELSRQLLMKCLRTRPQDRWTAADILDWCGQDNVRTGLLNEWKMYSSETRATRKVKSMYGFDDNDKTATPTTCTDDTSKRTNKRTKRSTPGTNQASKSRGRLKKHGSIEVNLDA